MPTRNSLISWERGRWWGGGFYFTSRCSSTCPLLKRARHWGWVPAISREVRVPCFRWSQGRTEGILWQPNFRGAGKGRGRGGREGRVPLYKWVSREAVDFPSRKQPAVGHCGSPPPSLSALSLLSPKWALLIRTTTKSCMLTSSSTKRLTLTPFQSNILPSLRSISPAKCEHVSWVPQRHYDVVSRCHQIAFVKWQRKVKLKSRGWAPNTQHFGRAPTLLCRAWLALNCTVRWPSCSQQLSGARTRLVRPLLCLARKRSLQSLGAWTDQTCPGYLWQVSAAGEVMGV